MRVVARCLVASSGRSSIQADQRVLGSEFSVTNMLNQQIEALKEMAGSLGVTISKSSSIDPQEVSTGVNQLPVPRLCIAPVSTCFQVQAQVAALIQTSADEPYNHVGGRSITRVIPMADAKGGCITLPVFNKAPRYYMKEVFTHL
jgi:hypothetical protein